MAVRTTGVPVLPVYRLHGLHGLHIQPLHPLAGQVSPNGPPFLLYSDLEQWRYSLRFTSILSILLADAKGNSLRRL